MTAEAALVSIQVGMPAEHGADSISKKAWTSGIFKYPVEGRVFLYSLNLMGDGQEDLDNHGGPYRAVLAYSADHYPVWRNELERPDFPYGSFGENFTVTDHNETTVCLGDVFQVGETRLQVSQPRLPCWKLARRNGIKDLTARVQARAQGGWYHRVLEQGYVQAGDSYTLLERPHPQFPIERVFRLVYTPEADLDASAELAALDALTPEWRDIFYKVVAR